MSQPGKRQVWISKNAGLMLPDNTNQGYHQESHTSETVINKMILWQRTRWALGVLTVTPHLQSTSIQSRLMMSEYTGYPGELDYHPEYLDDILEKCMSDRGWEYRPEADKTD
jgi:hypothetical protein